MAAIVKFKGQTALTSAVCFTQGSSGKSPEKAMMVPSLPQAKQVLFKS